MTKYVQDSKPTNPFGVGYRQQMVDRSKRLVEERTALQNQLDEQSNNGPYSYTNYRDSRNELRALKEDPNADPAAVAAAQSKFDEISAGRSDLIAQKDQNRRLLLATEDGLKENQRALNEMELKEALTPPGTVIVNAGNDPAANSTPPVGSDSNITGAVPPAQPLNVTTPASLAAGAAENPYETQIADQQAAQAQNQGQEDPYEASRLAAAAALNDNPPETDPPPVGDEDPEVAYYQSLQAENARAELAQQEAQATPVGPDGFPYPNPVLNQPGSAADDGTTEGVQQQVEILNAQKQQTLQARQNKPSSADWRVRIQLAPGADYLYKAQGGSSQGREIPGPGILAPLAKTDGVVFPYTPTIETAYLAKYQMSDLVHSNYRGYFYQSSAVEAVNIRGTFTAQDTAEAQYLLAVIHFFKSVTKMFYGKDQQAGTPPPLVYLSGFGQYQFNNHPCVVSSFNYNLPNDVDYIRADGFNNYGLNLENRRQLSSGPSLNGALGFLANKLGVNGLFPGGIPQVPNQGAVKASISNTTNTNSTYVPTKMEISLQLLPIQTRSQVSKQFSLKSFANGDLLKGGFW